MRQRLGLVAALLLLALSLVAMIAPAVAPYDPAEQWRDASRMGQPLAPGFHSIVHGNLGDSYYFHRPVTALLAEKLPTTAFMAGLIMLTALAIGIPLDMVAAVRHNSLIDRSILIVSTVLISAPTILLAVLLIYSFAYRLPLFPLSGTGSIRHWVLPTLSVALPIGVGYALFLRTRVLSVLSADYVRTAQSKGLAGGWIHLRHVLPNDEAQKS